MRRALHLCAILPQSSHEENIRPTQTEEHSAKSSSRLSRSYGTGKAEKLSQTRGGSKEIQGLNVMWYAGWDYATEKGY